MPETADPKKARYYPPTAFHFRVEFVDPQNEEQIDETSFTEVGGLTMEVAVEEIQEGGWNFHAHRVPGKTKFGNLVLKRGMGPGDSDLIEWATKGLREQDFVPLNVFIKLLNGKADNEGNIIKTWSFFGAWPVKLVVSDFKATDNTVVIESLELAYQYFDTDGTTGTTA